MNKQHDMRTEARKIAAPTLPSMAGLASHVVERINKFNARPMRREDDCRVLGWSLVEAS